MSEHEESVEALVSAPITVLFFFSGATGLAYQGIWFRRLTATWGSSSLAMAAVVSSFLIGLALGAFVAGKLAPRVTKPLAWYGILEVCIGVWALLVPLFISLVSNSALGTLSSLPNNSVALFSIRSIIAFMIIGFPCVCMGATLPLLVDFRCRQQESIGRATALLYGVNTFGASVGCYLTGFHLLPTLGSTITNLSVALANVAVGAGAIVVSAMSSQMQRFRAASETQISELENQEASPNWIFATAAIAGWAALTLEMVWARQLSIILGGSTYVFTATLCTVLLGISIGSLLYNIVRDYARTRELLFELHVLIIVGICLLTAVGQVLIPAMCRLAGSLRGLRDSDMSNGLVCAAIAVVLELGAAIAMGMLFPALAVAAKRKTASSADIVGTLYLWNTFGAGFGAIIASSLLVPNLGAVWTVAIALIGYLVALGLLAVHASNLSVTRLASAGIFGAGIVFMVIHTSDPLASNIGMYLYGVDRSPHSHLELVYFEEGRSCNVVVTENSDGHRSLRVNGKVDASTRSDQNMQLGCAYLSRFLRFDAQVVCVIGLGSGTTSGASLLFPDTRVECFEIEPAVYEASRYFSNINHSPWESARFQIVFDDARSAMKRSREHYDIIISEPSNPWIAGVSSLYTLEFYKEAKQQLRPGGMLAQWVQTYNFTQKEFNLILRTIQSVFPRVGLLRISSADTILIASTDELTPRAEQLDAAQEVVDSIAQIGKDLTSHFGSSDVRGLLLQHFVLDESGVRRLQSADVETVVNTDINMRLEFDAPRQLFRQQIPADQDVAAAIIRAMRANWFEQCMARWQCSNAQTVELAGVVQTVVESGNHDKLGEFVRSCSRVDPEEPLFRMLQVVFDDEGDPDADHNESPARMLSEQMADRARQIAVQLWRQKRYAAASKLFGQLTEAFPQSATSWMNLAVNYRDSDRHEDAAKAARRAMSIDPLNEFVRRVGKSFEGSNGKRLDPTSDERR